MIEKAYIEKIIDKYKYKVRIPRYDLAANSTTAVKTASLATAEVCTLPGCLLYYQVGDIVWVEFYHNQFSLPIIIGRAQVENNENTKSKVYLDDNSNLGLSFLTAEEKIKKLEQAVVLLLLLLFLDVELKTYTEEEKAAGKIPTAEVGDTYLDFIWQNNKHKYILTKYFKTN